MKYLIGFLLLLTAVCGYFWATDGPDSGMNYLTIALGVATLVLLLFNKKRTGGWLSDSAAGH